MSDVADLRTCKECGTVFKILEEEKEFYETRSLSLPKRCKECIKQRKGATGTKEEGIWLFGL